MFDDNTTTITEVESCLGRDYVLSPEQRQVLWDLQSNSSACQGIRAVAGAGKTVLLTGMLLAKLPTLETTDCIIWLTKSRKMRDEQVDLFRRYIGEQQLKAIALGRKSCVRADNDFEEEWDDMVTATLDEKCAETMQKLRTLKALLEQSVVDANINDDHSQNVMRLIEQMHCAQTALHNHRIIALSDILRKRRYS